MKAKTKTILFILFSFLLGILAGWIGNDRLKSRPMHTPRDFQNMLSEKLHFTARQNGLVDSILESHRIEMDAHRKLLFAMRDSIRMEIRKILESDQQQTFDALIQDMNNRESKNHDKETIKK